MHQASARDGIKLPGAGRFEGGGYFRFAGGFYSPFRSGAPSFVEKRKRFSAKRHHLRPFFHPTFNRSYPSASTPVLASVPHSSNNLRVLAPNLTPRMGVVSAPKVKKSVAAGRSVRFRAAQVIRSSTVSCRWTSRPKSGAQGPAPAGKSAAILPHRGFVLQQTLVPWPLM